MEYAEHEWYQHQSECDLVSPVPFSEQFSENENEEEHCDGDVSPMEHENLFQYSLATEFANAIMAIATSSDSTMRGRLCLSI